MELNLEDKAVFVAGSSRGIGRGIAEVLLDEGARVVLTGRDARALRRTAQEFRERFGEERILSLCADLSVQSGISDAVAATKREFGTVDVVVANIGSGAGPSGWATNLEDWNQSFDINLFPSVAVVKAFLPSMIDVGKGNLIFVASIVGLESVSAPLPYSAAKAALINYSKNLSRILGRLGIRVNAIAPGNVLFPSGSWETKLGEKEPEFEAKILEGVSLGRFGEPVEIGNVAAFLASEKSSFVTGACIVVDGGQTRSL